MYGSFALKYGGCDVGAFPTHAGPYNYLSPVIFHGVNWGDRCVVDSKPHARLGRADGQSRKLGSTQATRRMFMAGNGICVRTIPMMVRKSWSSVSSEFWTPTRSTARQRSSPDLASDLRRVYRDRVKVVCTDSPSQFNKKHTKPAQRKTALTDTVSEIYKIRFTKHLSFTAYNGNP